MDNPIKYTDLFDPSLVEGVKGLQKELNAVKANLEKMVKDAKEAAGQIRDAINNGSKTSKHTAGVNDMNKAYKNLNAELESVKAQLLAVNKDNESLVFTQKELNKMHKLNLELEKGREGTYAQISKRYQLMKVFINQLTEEERKNNAEVKQMVAESERLYNTMNMMQQATGKYQLQVGNYSKALGGLQLATNQVIREMPVLANGLSMFVMAISNNIPILVDNIKIFRAEQEALAQKGKETIPVWKAIISTIKSWQTLMIVVLSVLPVVIRRMNRQKKEQESLNNAMREGIDLQSALNGVSVKAQKSYISESAKLRTLYQATQDVNRSMDERVRIAQIMINNYSEELEGCNALTIAQGNMARKIDDVTNSMLKQAKTQAYLDKITELENKKLSQTLDIEEFKKGMPHIRLGRKMTLKQAKEYYDSQKELKDRQKALQETENTIARIRSMISLGEFETLWEEIKKGATSVEAVSKKLGLPLIEFSEQADKYFRQSWKAEIDAMEDGMEKELALNDYKYQTMIEDLESFLGQQELLEMEGRNTISKDQMAYIRTTIDMWKKQYLEEMSKIYDKWITQHPEMKVMIPGYEAPEGSKEKKSLYELMGFGKDADGRRFMKSFERAFNTAFSYMKKWMDMRIEMAHIAVESAEKEANSAKEALDIEQQARVNGYAHNVGLARKEYEEKLALKRQAIAEEERLAKIQQDIDAAQQVSSLLVATANLWAGYSKLPIVGQVLAGIATAAMWGSFAAAQVQAHNLVHAKKYGEGMSEYLDYGGSHASGNDIDFGTMKDGTRRRVERGEMVAVINKKNVNKYGVGQVQDIISSLNSGTFDEKYGLAFAGLGLANASADLSKVEKGIDTLVQQGEKKVMYGNGYRVEYYRNKKRIIKS